MTRKEKTNEPFTEQILYRQLCIFSSSNKTTTCEHGEERKGEREKGEIGTHRERENNNKPREKRERAITWPAFSPPFRTRLATSQMIDGGQKNHDGD